MPWELSRDPMVLELLARADVWIESFGCEIAPEFLQYHCHRPGPGSPPAQPVWINLEYLSAESFTERAHGLPSPIMSGPAKGRTRYFFYPGFTPRSGGLLREPDLARRQAGFDRSAWLAGLGLRGEGRRLISLFCYEPAALQELLLRLRQDGTPTRLMVTAGRASAALERLPGAPVDDSQGRSNDSLRATFLPLLSQTDFDHLLWSCDLNFVRGEDSLVRAIWAGKPLVWQIYPQQDNAHHGKLEAFLDTIGAPPSSRHFHRVWNGLVREPLGRPELQDWCHSVVRARQALTRQSDLGTRLSRFVESVRCARLGRPEKR